MPYLTSYESNPTLVEPARAQVAWVALWVMTSVWVLFQAARFGEDTVKKGLGAYFLSGGMSGFRQMLQIWAACMTFLLPMVAIAVAVCIFGAMPGAASERAEWMVTNFQYAALFLLVMAPIVLLAVSLGSRFGATIGYVLPLAFVVYGVFGVNYVDMLAESRNSAVINWIYTLSPHVHLADLTPRLVFKQGSMNWSEFMQVALYFVGLKLVLSTVSCAGFRVKPAA
ncbi:MAG: hypothetical protein ACPG32_14100 [Akkermansiaceae bacterium]